MESPSGLRLRSTALGCGWVSLNGDFALDFQDSCCTLCWAAVIQEHLQFDEPLPTYFAVLLNRKLY